MNDTKPGKVAKVWTDLQKAAAPFAKAWRRSGRTNQPPGNYLSAADWQRLVKALDALAAPRGRCDE
jgi:hypothetical protein